MQAFDVIKHKTKQLKKELNVIYVACKKPEIPWYTKALAVIVVSYALSPIDLIPDFIPVLGYLDDLILIPMGIYLVIKLIPKEVLQDCRIEAEESFRENKPRSWIAAGVIVVIWILIAAMLVFKFLV